MITMWKRAIILFIAIHVGRSQDDNNSSGTVTAAASTNSTMSVDFGPAKEPLGLCDTATDAVYFPLLKKLAQSNNEIKAVLLKNPNAKSDNSSGYFFGVVISIAKAFNLAQQIAAGHKPNGTSCLATNQQFGYLVGLTRKHGTDVVSRPLTGENKYHDMLQRFGASVNAALATAANCQGAPSPGKWLKVIIDLLANFKALDTAVKTSDVSSNCAGVAANSAGSVQSVDAISIE